MVYSRLQEKGKVSFEEFGLDAERRAHGMRFVPSLCTDMCCVFFVCNFYEFNEHKKDQIDHDLEENHLSSPNLPLGQEYQQTVIWTQI